MATINTDISTKVDITVKAEDSVSIALNITDSSGSVFPLNEYYVFFDIYGESKDTLIAASNITARNSELSGSVSSTDYFNIVSSYTSDLPAAITVTDSTGKLTISFTSTQTSITPGAYKYKMKLKKGSTIKTWMHGKFKFNE